jgi:hypothetical protein
VTRWPSLHRRTARSRQCCDPLAFAAPAYGALAQPARPRAAPAAAARSAPPSLRVGTLTLERCPRVSAYCGRIDRPLDPTGAIPGSISIHFEYYPHTAPGASAGTLVASEGGPGYAWYPSYADLRIDGPGGMTGRLDVRWQDEAPEAPAAIRGLIGGTRIAAEIAAPYWSSEASGRVLRVGGMRGCV